MVGACLNYIGSDGCGCKLWPEGILVALQDRNNAFSAHLFKLKVVVAVVAIAVVAIVPTSEAFAIKF